MVEESGLPDVIVERNFLANRYARTGTGIIVIGSSDLRMQNKMFSVCFAILIFVPVNLRLDKVHNCDTKLIRFITHPVPSAFSFFFHENIDTFI
ncbi:hypothetical protein SDC9_136244 [bioreactor metagenome]|uniref:Uncharacterized protein n=1 Tax=bioreactor metagenome TaxID=1076179 RepID=A0A645DIK0_9ZZZZ